MRDSETGEIFMNAPNWGEEEKNLDEENEREVHFPKKMLDSKTLGRMITFSSKQPIEKLSLAQKMYLHGNLVETLFFEFGFVIPNSTNSWEQTIVADSGNVLPAEVLSGNLMCETLFFCGEVPVHKTKYRIFYD
uniref:GMP phosphodiesterase delta subunit domain-containing protein n=1 Tax=Strombidium inclinatum TaxID=197538 RepID=A0A7S3IPN4_9SPIT|mmetsp:Transcript_32463/g.49672  ORF Transcript_32463/g.49672 Transcript_32463/m.49672 type:complete len:134 (+) Transcript_32463:111-512(+)